MTSEPARDGIDVEPNEWPVSPMLKKVIELEAEVERLKAECEMAKEAAGKYQAIYTCGHKPECGGVNELEGYCQCGWLQMDSAHDYIEKILAERDAERTGRLVSQKLVSLLEIDSPGMVGHYRRRLAAGGST